MFAGAGGEASARQFGAGGLTLFARKPASV